MKKYIMIAIFGLVAMLTFTIQFDSVPTDVVKQDSQSFIEDVQIYQYITVEHDLTGNQHVFKLEDAPEISPTPVGSLRSKPGWQTIEANILYHKKNTEAKVTEYEI